MGLGCQFVEKVLKVGLFGDFVHIFFDIEGVDEEEPDKETGLKCFPHWKDERIFAECPCEGHIGGIQLIA